ncbi:MAG: CocE/NonD family hydrolase [Cyanobacteria bacterium P01_D01_bin.1]
MLSIQAQQTLSMYTRDGVRLDADVYFPIGTGPFPVLLMRQPYGRAIASTIVYAHPRWYAAHGYIVVIQDVRGRGTSEGEFSLFAHEVADGEDTVQWAAQLSGGNGLPSSDGQVAMYGFSYQGMTQLQAAQATPPALKTVVPAMTGYHLYEDWAYENGALCFQLGLTWAVQLAAESARIKSARIKGACQTYQDLAAAARNLPLAEAIPACPKILEGTETFWHDWVRASQGDRYWQQLTPQLDNVDLPMLHIGGWFDPYLRGDLRLYQEMAARSQHLHHLWIGPWMHIPWHRKVGEMDFGPAAISPVDHLQIQWFDAILKGKAEVELKQSPPIHLFEMGRNQWRSLDAWPASTELIEQTKTYFLSSSGLANIREDSGALSEVPAKMQPVKIRSADTLVHDPWNPCPSVGGHSSLPAGVFERTAVDARGDVLTYTSAPLNRELRVVGTAEVVGAIISSTPSYDLCAVLSRVKDGRVYNLTQGYGRFESSKASSIVLPLHPTCFNIFSGECLRLSLSAACYPAFLVNTGTGAPIHQSRAIDAQIITLTLTTGGGDSNPQMNQPSFRLKLPVTLD